MDTGKVGELERRIRIRRNILRDVNYLLSKGMISDTEVYYLIKNFLKDYLSLDYEFTKDELFGELKNVYLPYNIRADFFKFVDRIFMFEYSQVSYSDEELKLFLEKFKGFLDYLLVPNSEKGQLVGSFVARTWKKKFSSFLKRIVFKSNAKVQKQDDKVSLPLSILGVVEASHVDINSLLEKIYYSLYNSDVDSAVELYKEVVDLYNKIPSDEKINYYETLNVVYDSIKNS
ncbi:MAG: hypothetical protein KKF65_00475 [Nanoarchaeota archaeon]|nr:hypothetical protein [Nanoarchaeota archaeon]